VNLVVALIAAFPGSALGQAAGLPAPAPALYRLLLAWTIALFGLGYAWLARQSPIERPLVVGAILGKAGVFAIVFLLWSSAVVPGRLVFLASADAGFALLFGWWLRMDTRRPEERRVGF